jgi:hypothetical protein
MSDAHEGEPTIPPTKPAETPREKRMKLMSSGDDYRNSTPHQVAALTWAVVEMSDATTAQMIVDEARNAILSRTADIAAATLAEQRTANLMAFYATNPNNYPAGVRNQIKTLLGIAETDNKPDVAQAPEPRSNVTMIGDARRSADEQDVFE